MKKYDAKKVERYKKINQQGVRKHMDFIIYIYITIIILK